MGYGIMGGLGEGMMANAATKVRAEEAQAQELRDMRLARYRADLDEEAAGSAHTRAMESTSAEHGDIEDREVNIATRTADMEMDASIDPRTNQALDQKLERDIELEEARGLTALRGRAPSAAELAHSERFERSHEDTTITDEYGSQVTVPAGAVIDKVSNRFYVPRGNYYYLSGIEEDGVLSKTGYSPDENGEWNEEDRSQAKAIREFAEGKLFEELNAGDASTAEITIERYLNNWEYLPGSVMSLYMPKTR